VIAPVTVDQASSAASGRCHPAFTGVGAVPCIQSPAMTAQVRRIHTSVRAGRQSEHPGQRRSKRYLGRLRVDISSTQSTLGRAKESQGQPVKIPALLLAETEAAVDCAHGNVRDRTCDANGGKVGPGFVQPQQQVSLQHRG
jgi:hypothetical protein